MIETIDAEFFCAACLTRIRLTLEVEDLPGGGWAPTDSPSGRELMTLARAHRQPSAARITAVERVEP